MILPDRLTVGWLELLAVTPLCRTSELDEDEEVVELFDSLRLRLDELLWLELPLFPDRLLLLRTGDLLRDRLDFCEELDLASSRGSFRAGAAGCEDAACIWRASLGSRWRTEFNSAGLTGWTFGLFAKSCNSIVELDFL